MASSTRWAWVWVNSGSWWWTERPGVLRFMGSKESDTTEQLNWTELCGTFPICLSSFSDFQWCRWQPRTWDLFIFIGLQLLYNVLLVSATRQKSAICIHGASLVAQTVKSLPVMQETRAQPPGWEDPLEEDLATHSSILAWEIPWTVEPGGLQSTGSQRVRQEWATDTFTLHPWDCGVINLIGGAFDGYKQWDSFFRWTVPSTGMWAHGWATEPVSHGGGGWVWEVIYAWWVRGIWETAETNRHWRLKAGVARTYRRCSDGVLWKAKSKSPNACLSLKKKKAKKWRCLSE